MKPNLFISYSRREVGFVDDFANQLEQKGYNYWLDYRSLVPGKPWEEQIYQGIMNADIILLVVSNASIASENVRMEWKRVIGQKKRVILLIFEAVDLPAELEKYEWVDFRGNYNNALNELDRQLQIPEQEKYPAPQMGFRIPPIVWVACGLSAVIALMSLGALWTLFIPFILIPLPFRIISRSFHYLLVEASLIMLPLALYLTSDFTVDADLYNATFELSMLSIPFVIALLLVLRSAGMQRWGKPEAIRPYSLKHSRVNEFPKMRPVAFFIDHAPQDRVVAQEIAETFKTHGHLEAKDVASSEAVFMLVSAFKADTEVDWSKQILYPVILQSNEKLSRQLSRVQWLDFRMGVKKVESIAKFLCEPEMLLRALCIRPTGSQMVLPTAVLYLIYFIALLAVICIGSWFPYVIQYLPDIVENPDLDVPMMQLVTSLILFGVISFFMTRQLITRKGPAASFIGLTIGMLLLGALIYWQILIDESVLEIVGDDDRGFSSLYPGYFYMFGSLVMVIYLFIKRADLRRWFPAKNV